MDKFFRYCIKCGKRFKPTGRHNKVCIECLTPTHKSQALNKLKKKINNNLTCDKCGWTTSKLTYRGSGECYKCFEGLMGGGR